MSHETSGSAKLKEKCQTIASLTPEEIGHVAGGAWGLQTWMIRGIPADIFRMVQPQLPADVQVDRFGF